MDATGAFEIGQWVSPVSSYLSERGRVGKITARTKSGVAWAYYIKWRPGEASVGLYYERELRPSGPPEGEDGAAWMIHELSR
jgi:hypothetical protein